MKTLSSTVAFQDEAGNALANGSIILTLASGVYEIAAGGGQVVGQSVIINLDATGKISGTPQVWASDELTPQVPYTVTICGQKNGLGPIGYATWLLAGSSPIDLSQMVSTVAAPFALPGLIYQAPAGNQAIVQPAGTSLNVNRFENIRFADQFASIAAAISDLPASGGMVLVPSGTYTLTSALTIPSNVMLRGAGRQSTILLFTGATDGITVAANSSDFGIEDLTIQTSNATGGKAIAMNGSSGTSGTGAYTIRNVDIVQTGSGRWAFGFWASFSESAHVIGLRIFISSTVGVYLTDSCNQLKFFDLEITGGLVSDLTFNRGIWVDTPGTGAPEFFGVTSQGAWSLGSAVFVSGHHPKFYGLHAEGTVASADGGDVVVSGTSEVSILGGHIVQQLVVTGTVRGFLASGLDACGAVTFSSTTQGAFLHNCRVTSITDNGTVGNATDNGNGWINCRNTSGSALRDKGMVEKDNGSAASTSSFPSGAAFSFPNGAILYWRDSGGTNQGAIQWTGADQLIFTYAATKQITWRNSTPANKLTLLDAAFSVLAGCNFQTYRIKANQGTAYVAADTAIALSAGWGNTAAVSAATGSFDQCLTFSVTANGTGIGANPTITITFKDGTFTNAPVFVVTRNDLSSPFNAPAMTWSESATALTITLNGTPLSGSVYTFRCLALGK